MTSKRHKNDTKTFEELTFDEQARSINASIVNLQKAIFHHISHSGDTAATQQKCLSQIHRFFGRLLANRN